MFLYYKPCISLPIKSKVVISRQYWTIRVKVVANNMKSSLRRMRIRKIIKYAETFIIIITIIYARLILYTSFQDTMRMLKRGARCFVCAPTQIYQAKVNESIHSVHFYKWLIFGWPDERSTELISEQNAHTTTKEMSAPPSNLVLWI